MLFLKKREGRVTFPIYKIPIFIRITFQKFSGIVIRRGCRTQICVKNTHDRLLLPLRDKNHKLSLGSKSLNSARFPTGSPSGSFWCDVGSIANAKLNPKTFFLKGSLNVSGPKVAGTEKCSSPSGFEPTDAPSSWALFDRLVLFLFFIFPGLFVYKKSNLRLGRRREAGKKKRGYYTAENWKLKIFISEVSESSCNSILSFVSVFFNSSKLSGETF
ncbi:hypothetical protein E2320_013664, partial [Naja naja]